MRSEYITITGEKRLHFLTSSTSKRGDFFILTHFFKKINIIDIIAKLAILKSNILKNISDPNSHLFSLQPH